MYGMFSGVRIDNNQMVEGMYVEYDSDSYIITMLGSCHKNTKDFDIRFGNETIKCCGYRVYGDTVKQNRTLDDYHNGNDFERRYHEVVDGE